jgi:ATP-dependent DNA ligase
MAMDLPCSTSSAGLHGDRAVLCAFDLIELNGEDLRRSPIEDRKRTLAKLVRGPHPGTVLNEHYEGDEKAAKWRPFKLGTPGRKPPEQVR